MNIDNIDLKTGKYVETYDFPLKYYHSLMYDHINNRISKITYQVNNIIYCLAKKNNYIPSIENGKYAVSGGKIKSNILDRNYKLIDSVEASEDEKKYFIDNLHKIKFRNKLLIQLLDEIDVSTIVDFKISKFLYFNYENNIHTYNSYYHDLIPKYIQKSTIKPVDFSEIENKYFILFKKYLLDITDLDLIKYNIPELPNPELPNPELPNPFI